MTLTELKIGEKAIVESISDSDLGKRLMELGVLPGEEIKVEFVAPLGDPIAVSVSGCQLSLRKSDAEHIICSISKPDR